MHTHGCRYDWGTDLAIALRYRSDCVTVCSLGLYSNISWVAMLSTVVVGGTIVVLPAFSAASLADAIERHGVTHGGFVPVQFQRLLELPGIETRNLSSLQAIMCCGSPLPAPLKRATRDTLDCELIELYGLTEGIITTLAPEDFDAHIESVGKPIPGQQLKLVRDDDVEAAPGELGEICGYGRLVMEGYHQRPEATEEATWVDPEGRRWLRTGDIGRLDDDGFLYIVDRKKDMILSGSQNIYPADIEAVMREHPVVADVAVVGVPSERWGETPLALVVVAAASDAPDPAALVEWTNAACRQAAATGRRRVRRRPAAQSEWQDPQARVAQAVRRLGESQVTTPAAAEAFFTSGDGLQLFYRDFAPLTQSSKLPVLCLPGLTRNSRDFTHVAERIRQDRRVLCADLRGRGRSQHDPVWQNYHPGTYLADIGLLLQRCGRRRVACCSARRWAESSRCCWRR